MERTGRMAGKVALITGAGRGMGRAHAVRIAREGGDVVLMDLCREVESTPYGMSGEEDLAETVRLVEEAGGRALARPGDVRDQAALDALVAAGVAELGPIDVVVPNAGLVSFGPAWELTEDQWTTTIDVLLTGVWHTVKAAIPTMIEAGNGGSIVIIGSSVGSKAAKGIAHYVAAKHGLVGLCKTLALELAEHYIRVNLVAPGSTHTEMAGSDAIIRFRRPDLESPTVDDADESLRGDHLLPVRWAEPDDISAAVTWLCSSEANFITGAILPVDSGWSIK